ncbi:GntR family transcriptional regulator [Actinoplanes sp. LDG1-06]|uniref:GntR family transcriptional regulator n=1 Tax=Paractinoplanes ovalisporus TaxID=2810368 RepID=A0ABS2A7C7_9ACTN|nr:GntR family transcriptional regulator [Actinoplanes ovalisporus]MBM2615692.1 GntR family transcriptional regulator [Actinoplanes ovalisporus]
MLPTGHPLGQTESDRAYRKLRDLILRGRLAPGSSLVEADLMESLAVGRTPLREAIRALAGDGLVEVIGRRGTYVTHVDVRNCGPLLDLRLAVERVVAASVAANARPGDVKELGDFLDAAGSGASADDLDFDAGFHDRLLLMCANPYITPIYWRLVAESMRLLAAVGAPLEPVRELLPEFRRAHQALLDGDAAALEDALVTHVMTFRTRFEAALGALPAAIRSAAISATKSF